MRPGLDADDGYRMVEDELLETAHLFTAHLHAAEYRRLKAKLLAGGRSGPAAIKRPSIPVAGLADNALPADVRARRGRESRERSQARAVKRLERDAKGKGRVEVKTEAGVDDAAVSGDGNDEDDETPWAGTSLFGLMEGRESSSIRRSAAPSLSKVMSSIGSGALSTTRAAAGFTRGSSGQSGMNDRLVVGAGSRTTGRSAPGSAAHDNEIEDDETEDDLDGPPTTTGTRFQGKGLEATTWPSASKSAGGSARSVTRPENTKSGSDDKAQPEEAEQSRRPPIWSGDNSDDEGDLFSMLRSSKRAKTNPIAAFRKQP